MVSVTHPKGWGINPAVVYALRLNVGRERRNSMLAARDESLGPRIAPLKLISCSKFPDGVVTLHYGVHK